MEHKKRLLWQSPWQYRESVLLLCGILATGFALQLTLGPFNFFLLHYPVNLGVAVGLTLLLGLSALARKTHVFQWLAGVPFCVALMGALLCFGLVMGLTPQNSGALHEHGLPSILGFTRVTTSWPFVLLYALTLVSLGLVIVRRLASFRLRDMGFFCNHLGLWILLLAAGLGAADLQRVVMHIREGDAEWRVYDAHNTVLELPLAIRLNDFIMEEYPPRLMIIDRESGKPQPEDRPDSIPLDTEAVSCTLGDWSVTVNSYIHEAVRSGDTYKISPMPASTPAALVTATSLKTGEKKAGWVCSGGNIPGFFSSLTLDSTRSLVMSQPEPRRFVSDITVITQDGLRREAQLEVNSPLSIGPWMLCQYGYDEKAGKMSTYTSIELIMDAWLWPAYLGIVLLCIGSLQLIWTGTGRQRHQHADSTVTQS